jgi:quercetin 2,3-dioxygenase
MIQIFPAKNRYHADHGWLKSNFSFSFADYYDPTNLHFGHLRVLNDDSVAPNKGFGTHPHQEMEIVSIVLKGYLQHKDSAGHSATTTWGGIQRMTAGTGVAHSEMNPSDSEEVQFMQLWFFPDTKGLEPSYEQTNYDPAKMQNNLLPVVSKYQRDDSIAYINQDLTIYLSDLEADQTIRYTQPEGRKIFVFVIEGEITLNGDHTLGKRDSARITETSELSIQANANSRFMLIDLA